MSGLGGIEIDVTERKQAEAAARAYQENLRRLIEDAALGVVVNNLEEVLFANRAAYGIVGLDAPEDLGANFNMFSIILEEDRPILAERLRRRAAGQDVPPSYEVRVRRLDGDIIWIQSQVQEIEWEGRKATLAWITDITERKRADQELRANQELLDRIFEATPVPLAVVRTADATYLKANAATYELFGLSEAEMFEKRSPELYADVKDREMLLKELGKSGIVRNFEVKLHNFAGRGTRDCLMSMVPAHYGNDAVYVVAAFDITERKQVEQERAQALAEFTAVMETIDYGIVFMDSDLRARVINRAFTDLWQMDRDVVQQQPTMADLIRMNRHSGMYNVADDDFEDFVEERVAAVRAGAVPTTEITRGDGKTLRYQCLALDDGGRMLTYLDITAERQREEEILQNQELLDRIIETVPLPLTIARNPDGRFLKVNKAAADFHNLSVDELMQHKVPEAFANLGSLKEALVRLEQSDGELKNFEVQMRRIGTGEKPWAIISASPINYFGEVAMLATTLDITERKQAERQLADAFEVISSSIEYASNIQLAALPSTELLSMAFSDQFVIWEPRDVVGGDIYWCLPIEDGYVLAVADCTGHGVPGAFITLVASGALRYALNRHPDAEPAVLIADMNRFIKEVLAQYTDDSPSDDGLELGVCRISANGGGIDFAGARFSLWQAANGEIREFKGDKTGIGYCSVPINIELTSHHVDAGADSRYYLISDGFNDQVGGEKRRALGKKRLLKLLQDNVDEPMDRQRTAVMDMFKAYQGNELRRDDITMVGFKL